MDLKLFEQEPEQIIINEYQIGQGITKHTDVQVFGPTIASLSLCSDAEMILGRSGEESKLPLQKNSLLALSGPARSQYYHRIPPVKQKKNLNNF